MKTRPSDEEIARALRAHARKEEEAEKLDEARWQALLRGEASAEEIAAIERLAEVDPGAREDLALFEPVSGEARRRYVDAITAELGRDAATTAPEAPRRLDSSAKRRAARWFAPVSIAAAMAAAIALAVVARPHGGSGGELPAYALTFTGGEATSRGAPTAGLPVLDAGSRFTLALRPETAVSGPLGVTVLLVQGESAEVVEGEIKIAAGGAVHVAARLGAEIHARPGEAEIVAVIARPEALPSPPVDARALAREGRRIARVPVRIAGTR